MLYSVLAAWLFSETLSRPYLGCLHDRPGKASCLHNSQRRIASRHTFTQSLDSLTVSSGYSHTGHVRGSIATEDTTFVR